MKVVGGCTLKYLRHSRLAAYRSCSRKFKFHYIDKITPSFSPVSFAFRITFHKAVEEALVMLLAGGFPPVEELMQVFAAAFDGEAAKLRSATGRRSRVRA